jgi:tripartite-type tricarboxylate transporter receptor subunit TctC
MGFSHSHRAYRAAIIVFTVFAVGGQVVAQGGYPSRPIRVFTITPPGGPSDIAARLIGDRLLPALGQPVIVEPKVGAGGSLAVGHVAKSAPDGYSLVMSGDAAIVTNLSLYKKLAYDPVHDLAPISQVAFTTNILAVPVDLPVKTVQDLVALARAQPWQADLRARWTGLLTASGGRSVQVRSED